MVVESEHEGVRVGAPGERAPDALRKEGDRAVDEEGKLMGAQEQ